MVRFRVLPKGRMFVYLRDAGYSAEQVLQILSIVMPEFDTMEKKALDAAYDFWKARHDRWMRLSWILLGLFAGMFTYLCYGK